MEEYFYEWTEKSKRSNSQLQKFRTRKERRRRTTLFGWLWDAETVDGEHKGWPRFYQICLHVVGLGLSPLTLTLGPVVEWVWATVAPRILPASWLTDAHTDSEEAAKVSYT